ncbi:pyridoxamine 5'-phosphate oxidase family protein [Candidatus Dojkabacteria bacterium]|nr:pyridoxamine 5'-phosphate oxidase family protein [Candidatus Dojkabacteria bacterium]
MNKEIFEFLKHNKLITLATSDSEFPWVCNLYYVVDDNLHFYFLSSPQTIHAKQLMENNKVAFTVTDTHQTPTDKKKAIQATGIAKKVTDLKKVIWFISQFTKDPKKYNAKEIVKSIGRVVYEITPTKMKFFNQELYEEEGGFKWVEIKE